MGRKKKDISFHIAHNYKQFEYEGIKFWAKDEINSQLYIDYLKEKMKKNGVIK